MAYTYKVWIVDGKEHFEYGNGQTRKKDFPFAESLMKLLYLDIWSFADLFEGMGKSIVKLYETKEQQYSDNVLSALNTVAKKHIYFELLRLDWWERLEKAKAQGYKDIVVLLPRKKLPHTPANIHTMQKQMKALFAQVLDLDLSPKESVQQKMVQYYNNRGGDQLNTFQFQPQAMSFEIIGPKTFTEVLYPKDIYDIIDYFVREFVKRKQPIRLCKNCGRYFAVSGRINTEYCDRPTDDKGRTCKDIDQCLGTEKRKDDEVFKVYRREYKKRFGWIKAGKIEKYAFYAWSKKAREEKTKCDAGGSSLQEFTKWLKES